MSRRSRKQRRPVRGEVVKALPPSVYSGNLTNTPQTYGLGDVINSLTSRNVPALLKPLPRNQMDATPFGPLNPLTPAPLDPARRDTERPEPRVTEYPVGWNIPGNEQRLVPWTVLREAARTVDVMRRCIEIRKRHIRSLKWAWTVSADTIQEAFRNDPRRGHEDIQVELREKFYPEIQRLTAFWQRPWKSNGLSFGQWINGAMEHHLVYDGIPVYPRTTYGGDLLDLELVDPTTIKPLLDWRGARPLPPYPAFQQILYGFPRGEFEATVEVDEAGNQLVDHAYLADQLYYHVENFRYGSWPYGFSAVEQALISARLYLRRQGWMLAEYDDGSTPLTWLIPEGTAEQLDPRQRREWEVALNDELAGQTAARHRVKVAFPGFKPEMMPSVDERYKPEYDLYLMKLLASHFGVTIAELGFTEAKGLGSSGYHEGQEDVQDRVGRRPDTEMLASIIQDLSQTFLHAPPELEFQFLGLESEDEAAADDVAKSRMARGSMTVNEDRRRIGLPLFDFPEADMPMVETGRGVVFLDGASTLALPGAMIGPAEAPPTTTDPDAKPGDEQGAEGEPAEQSAGNASQEGGDAKPGDGDTKPAAKAEVGKHATPNPAVADAVYRQLLDDYPAEALGWVRAAHWQGPQSVALDRIDFSHADTWQASHEKRKVRHFAGKIQAGKMKPIILVREPHNPKLIVIDGHHRALAYQKLGRPAVAYIARVGTADGPWDEMHDQQYHGDSFSTANSAPVSAPPAPASSDADKAAEQAAYRRWRKRNPHPTRPFVFKHLNAAEQAALTKAADDGGDGEDPKADQPPDTRWPGWQMDLTLAAYWAQKIRQTLTGEVGTGHVADAWHRAYPGWRDGDPIPDPRAWLATQDVHLSGPLAQVMADLYTEGYLVGDRSAQAVLAAGLGATVDWGDWKPGDPQAARLILSGDGSDVGLERLLQSAGVTISSIAEGRLDEVAAVLADGLENGLGPDEIAAALRGVLDDPKWARMVALTETNRAMSAATLQRYRDNGVEAKEWLTALDQRVCGLCSDNEGDGPIPLSAYFSSGDDAPPGHPSCRCAVTPSTLPESTLTSADADASDSGAEEID